MGDNLIYPSKSEKYMEKIDKEVNELLISAHGYAEFILKQSKDLIREGAAILKRDRILSVDDLNDIIQKKYVGILDLVKSHK